jgi:hypothetical protein
MPNFRCTMRLARFIYARRKALPGTCRLHTSAALLLPEFWHFVTFCQSNFSFEPCFQ